MNLVLIGMPGSGKSTLGIIIAKILGMDFIDADVFIQKNENMKLQEIIKKKGVEGFLDTECENILKIDAKNTVIATGGSAVLREKAMLHLKKNAKTVFIDVEETEIKKRLYNMKTRGIAMDEGETVSDIYKKRRPYYLKYADIVVKTDGLSLEEAAIEIVKSTQ